MISHRSLNFMLLRMIHQLEMHEYHGSTEGLLYYVYISVETPSLSQIQFMISIANGHRYSLKCRCGTVRRKDEEQAPRSILNAALVAEQQQQQQQYIHRPTHTGKGVCGFKLWWGSTSHARLGYIHCSEKYPCFFLRGDTLEELSLVPRPSSHTRNSLFVRPAPTSLIFWVSLLVHAMEGNLGFPACISILHPIALVAEDKLSIHACICKPQSSFS